MATLAMFVALGGGAYAAATIGPGDIKRNAVRSKHIKPNTVASKHIKRAAVRPSDIRNNAVTTPKIADAAVTSAKIAPDAVTSGQLANGAVTNGKLANDAVTTGKIANDAVTNGKLANDAVTTGKIADGAVTGADVQDFGLRLHDLGGQLNAGTATVSSNVNVPGNGCTGISLTLFNPAPPGVIGSLVVGFLTDSQGDAALPNAGFVVPTMISETSQGGAIPNLMVCTTGSAQTVPAGSIFHYQLIGP
jgi:hypothetical protein